LYKFGARVDILHTALTHPRLRPSIALPCAKGHRFFHPGRYACPLNTIESIVTKVKLASSAEQQAVARSIESLAELRNVLITRQFGPQLFSDYQDYEKRKSANPGVATEQDNHRFAGIEAWMRSNRILE